MPKGKTPRKQRVATSRKGKPTESQDASSEVVMTPGWVTGSADLFKEPLSTPSPFKGRVMTRRSSMYVRTKAAKTAISEVTVSQKTKQVTKVTKSKSATTVSASAKQDAKTAFSPVLTRARRTSVYAARKPTAKKAVEMAAIEQETEFRSSTNSKPPTESKSTKSTKAQVKKTTVASPKSKVSPKRRTPSPPKPKAATKTPTKRSRLSGGEKKMAAASKILSPKSTSRAKAVQVIVLRTPYKGVIKNRSTQGSSPALSRKKRLTPVAVSPSAEDSQSDESPVKSTQATSMKKAKHAAVKASQAKATTKTTSPKNSGLNISSRKFYAKAQSQDSQSIETAETTKTSKVTTQRRKSSVSPKRSQANSPGSMEKKRAARKRSVSVSPKRFKATKPKSSTIRTPKLSAADMKNILESSYEITEDESSTEEEEYVPKSAKRVKKSKVATPKNRSLKAVKTPKRTPVRAKLRSTPGRTQPEHAKQVQSQDTPVAAKTKKTPNRISSKATPGRKTPERITETISKSAKKSSVSATNVREQVATTQIVQSSSTPSLARKLAAKSLRSPKPNTPSSTYSTPYETNVSAVSQKSVRITTLSANTPAKIQRKATPGRAQVTTAARSVRKVTPGRKAADTSVSGPNEAASTSFASMSVKKRKMATVAAPVDIAAETTTHVKSIRTAVLDAAAVGAASIGTPEKALRVLGKKRSTQIVEKAAAAPVRTSTPRKDGSKRLAAPPPVSEIRSKRLRSAVVATPAGVVSKEVDEVDFTSTQDISASLSMVEEGKLTEMSQNEDMEIMKKQRPEHGWWWCAIM